jgi:L-ascorbate metabolism protein UlaG (beta-lactamase superfamily)
MQEQSRWYKEGAALLGEIENSRPGEGAAWIWYLGQHGFVISLGGLVFYIDVILNGFADREGRAVREYPPPFEPGAVRRLDYALCTHNHGDHLNMETLLPLAQANPGARFIVPRPWRQVLTGGGIREERVLGAREGEELDLGPVKVLPVMAVHTRFIQDEAERDGAGDCLCLGYILKAGGVSIYHAGDTWAVPALVESLKAAGPLSVAVLPINGTDWERSAAGFIGNMGALDAARLARAIPADLCVPAHYDMMAFNSENPARFADYMYQRCPERRFHIFALGERFIYQL